MHEREKRTQKKTKEGIPEKRRINKAIKGESNERKIE